EPRGAEHGVDQRVGEHVAVGMAGEPARRIDLQPGEHERHAVLERVRIDAESDPNLTHPSGSWRGRRPSNTVTVSYPASRARSIARSRSRPAFCGTCASEASVI